MRIQQKHRRHSIDSRRRIGAEYLIFPVVFCLLLCAVCAPFLYGAFHYAKNGLFSAQQTQLAATDNDVQTVVTYGSPETVVPNAPVAEGYARLVSDELGVDTIVYYGFNRAALREGAAQLQNAKVGEGKLTVIGGYAVNVFAGLSDAAAGDRVTLSTNDTAYAYTVTSTAVLEQDELSALDFTADDARLILFTTYPEGVFATNTDKLFCVFCTPQSETEVLP